LPPSTVSEIKRVGTVLVHDAVSVQEALEWKQEIQEYIARNRSLAKGFPKDDPQVSPLLNSACISLSRLQATNHELTVVDGKQVWEVYNSIAQTKARTHPNLLASQKFLLSLFHTSDPESPVRPSLRSLVVRFSHNFDNRRQVSTTTPVSYYDRLRIRFPGDSVFALGPHIDGGSLERWEDPGIWTSLFDSSLADTDTSLNRTGFRSCFAEVLKGGSKPQNRLDSWDLSPRLNANSDLYNGAGQCSVFRMFQ